MTDILEQAKALLEKTIDPYMEGEPREIPYPTLRSFFNWEDGILRELIAEVEWLRSKEAHYQGVEDWYIANHLYEKYRLPGDALAGEIERLRSENKIISDRAAHHDRQDAKEIELLAARIAELEALNESLMENGNDLRTRCQKAESDVKYLQDCFDLKVRSDWQQLTLYTERLVAAFLDHLAARLYYEHYPGVSDAYSWHDYPEDACQMRPKEMFRQKAREALEKIKAETGSGDHVAGANKLILTAAQREEEGKRDA
jgi:hypothetical protein